MFLLRLCLFLSLFRHCALGLPGQPSNYEGWLKLDRNASSKSSKAGLSLEGTKDAVGGRLINNDRADPFDFHLVDKEGLNDPITQSDPVQGTRLIGSQKATVIPNYVKKPKLPAEAPPQAKWFLGKQIAIVEYHFKRPKQESSQRPNST